MKLSLPPKLIDGFLSFIPCWMLMYFFAGFFKFYLTLLWPNSGFWCCVFLTSSYCYSITNLKFQQHKPKSKSSYKNT
jgi:hypothetical protein